MFKTFLVSMAVVLALISTGVKGEAQLGLNTAGVSTDVAAYTAVAADFDGSADSLARGADLSGAVDDRQGTLSFWFRLDGGNGSFTWAMDTTNARVRLFKSSGDRFEFDLKNSGGSFIFFDVNGPLHFDGADWHHFIMSWDTLADVCLWYIDDVNEPVSNCDTPSPPEVDGTQADWFIGISNTASSRFNACVSEFYYHQTLFLDLTTEGNRRLFNDGTGGHGGGKPVNLGADGSTPLSSQPIVYLNKVAADFHENNGSGGNFVVTGALSACSTSPSD